MMRRIIFFIIAVFFFFAPRNAYAGCCFEIDNQGRSFCRNASASSECTSPGNFNPSDDCRDNKCAEAASAAASQDSSCPPGKFCLQVPFPGSEQVESAVQENILLTYIRTVFQFAVWVAIFLGIFMIMVGGFLYLTSAGSPQRAGRAKDFISNAVLGLLLALFSFLILQTINPRLVDLSIPKIQAPNLATVGDKCCYNRNAEPKIRHIALAEGDLCSSIDAFLGPGWTECENSNCCVCNRGLETVKGVDVWNNLSETECLNKNSPQTWYSQGHKNCRIMKGICEELNKSGALGEVLFLDDIFIGPINF